MTPRETWERHVFGSMREVPVAGASGTGNADIRVPTWDDTGTPYHGYRHLNRTYSAYCAAYYT